jgi:hypothetical protein
VPFTIVVITQTNQALLARGRELRSPRSLLIRWGRLHAVHTVLSLFAVLTTFSIRQ